MCSTCKSNKGQKLYWAYIFWKIRNIKILTHLNGVFCFYNLLCKKICSLWTAWQSYLHQVLTKIPDERSCEVHTCFIRTRKTDLRMSFLFGNSKPSLKCYHFVLIWNLRCLLLSPRITWSKEIVNLNIYLSIPFGKL